MDKKGNNKKVYTYTYIISFIVLFILFGYFLLNKWWIIDQTPENKDLVDREISANLVKAWDFKGLIDEYESKWTWDLSYDDNMRLIYSYLNHGTYTYNEQENSKKAQEILEKIWTWNWETLYYLAYSKEIIKNYTWALEDYNKSIETVDINDAKKSLSLNQIWHVYDLMWDLDKAYEYYERANRLDPTNITAITNLWRYEVRKNNLVKAKEYFEKSLSLSVNKNQRSELYYTLSSLELELNWLTPDIDKAIEYARKSIEEYPEYPMWYVMLARSLYMKNDPQYDKEIEDNLNKSISLNPNWYYAYQVKAWYEYDKWNTEKRIEAFKKSMDNTNLDMILMDNEREIKKMQVVEDIVNIGIIDSKEWDKDQLFRIVLDNQENMPSFIKIQLKRPNYGIFNSLKDEESFKNLLKDIKI